MTDQPRSNNSFSVSRVAKLARLNLSDTESERLQSQLDQVLKLAQSLDILELDETEPYYGSIPSQTMRDDEVRPSLGQEDALRNAPDQAEGCYRVPPVFESR